MIAEYNGANALLRRHVFAPGLDQPIVTYEGATVSSTTRRFLSADERGSIIAVSDSTGGKLSTNGYDEYGIPQSPASATAGTAGRGTVYGRFGYTGQAWLPEVGLYYYKARVYSPGLGRFLQTDPIGQVDQGNLYAYVMNDPINKIDPTGTFWFVVGAATGALIDYGVQVGVNRYVLGKSWGDSLTDINANEVILSAALGTWGGVGLTWGAMRNTIKLVPIVGKNINFTVGQRIGIGAYGLIATSGKAAIKGASGMGIGAKIGWSPSSLFYPGPDLSSPAVWQNPISSITITATAGRYEPAYDDQGNLIGYRDKQTGEIVPVEDDKAKAVEE